MCFRDFYNCNSNRHCEYLFSTAEYSVSKAEFWLWRGNFYKPPGTFNFSDKLSSTNIDGRELFWVGYWDKITFILIFVCKHLDSPSGIDIEACNIPSVLACIRPGVGGEGGAARVEVYIMRSRQTRVVFSFVTWENCFFAIKGWLSLSLSALDEWLIS